jgi:hypothetical protein
LAIEIDINKDGIPKMAQPFHRLCKQRHRQQKHNSVFGIVGPSRIKQCKLVLLTNDASTAVLAVDANNKIIIVDSFKNLGWVILELPTNLLVSSAVAE